MANNKDSLYKLASSLALITIIYNLAEGLISVFFGLEDETIALFGFGLDSFVEVISGIGIWHMVSRLRQYMSVNPDRFERGALRITGSGFYILAVGLILTAGANLYRGHSPDTTFWGIVVSTISIVTMWILLHYKLKVGRQLDSDAIIADANCTKACLYLSIILLISSAGYELTGIGGLDSIGAIGIAWFSLKEGKESFEKAKGMSCGCGRTCKTDKSGQSVPGRLKAEKGE